MKTKPLTKILYAVILVFAILLDRIVKIAVVANMKLYESIPVIKDVFHITYVENTGAAFSILEGKTVILSVFTAIVVIFLLFMVFTDKIKGKAAQITVVLIAAGGVGNLIDRIFRGSVVDMFDFCLINFAVFNVADIFVTCGGILFLILFFVSKGEVIQWNSLPKKKMSDKD